jgi:hypothetical protein
MDPFYETHALIMFAKSDAYAKESVITADAAKRERLAALAGRCFKIATWLRECGNLANAANYV